MPVNRRLNRKAYALIRRVRIRLYRLANYCPIQPTDDITGTGQWKRRADLLPQYRLIVRLGTKEASGGAGPTKWVPDVPAKRFWRGYRHSLLAGSLKQGQLPDQAPAPGWRSPPVRGLLWNRALGCGNKGHSTDCRRRPLCHQMVTEQPSFNYREGDRHSRDDRQPSRRRLSRKGPGRSYRHRL